MTMLHNIKTSGRHAAMSLLCVVLLALCGACGSSSRGTDGAATGLAYEAQRRFDVLFLEAIRQKEQENYDAEYELLRAALKVNPDASEALYELGQLMLSFNGMTDTLERAEGDSLMRRAIALDPTNSDYKETLARMLAQRGKYADAIAIYKEMADEKPSGDLLSVLTGLQEETGDYAGAIESLSRLEQIEGKSERYSIEKFKLYHELNDYAQAYAAIEELCAEYPSDLRYRVLLGDLYLQYGEPDKALGIYNDVLSQEPDNSLAQISLLAYYKNAGQDSLYQAFVKEVVLNPRTQPEAKVEAMRGYVVDALQTEKDTAEVLALFRQALQQPLDDRGLPEICAYYMTSVGMPTTSLEPVMVKMLEVEPDYDRARLQLLDILLRRSDMKGVANVCHEGQLYNPSQIIYYYYEGLAYIRLENYEAALAALEAGAERISENTDLETAAELYASLGDIRHELGKKEEAYAAYDEALTYAGDNLMCLNNYAYFLSLDGIRLDEAAAMSLRTVKAEPKNATFLDTYAWILYQQKQYTQARIFIDQALQFTEEDEENVSIFDHAGDIYYRCGEKAEALKYWKKALGLAKEKKERDDLRRKVRNRRP